MSKMYNEEVKETFLQYLIDEEGYTDETVHVFRFVFYKSYDVEDILQKDMYDFNMSELKQVLLNANKSTLNSVRAFASMMKKYIDWAIHTGLVNSNINPMDMFTTKDYEECIDRSRKLFISEDELIEIENRLANYQDKIILRLLFEGVNGYEVSELINLKKDDVDYANKRLRLYDNKNGERFINVSDRCLDIIEKAIREETYYARNAEKESKHGKDEYEYFETEHVIKNVLTGRTKKPADKNVIYRRIYLIKELFDMPYLTVKNVWRSGMIKMAVDLYKEEGELTNKQLAKIAEQFGLGKIINNGHETYNYHAMRQFINRDNILDLYGIDIGEK
ncbi:integrase [Geobacillus virus E3]|uniref:integrase n=1 Tax=Geobacillus virus E3 TaxID=1572712 RepID=UPI0006719AB6|nr:integrase [Geobacillus virus E3]AJA41465.1 integrase-like protein [Geobacillus virus E3]